MLMGRTSINLQKCKILFFTFPSCEKDLMFQTLLKRLFLSLFGPIEKSGFFFFFQRHEFHAKTPAPSETLASNDITGVGRQHLYPEYFAVLFKSRVEMELPHPSSYTVSHYWPGEPSLLVATWHSGQLFVSIQLNSGVFSSLLHSGSRLLNKLQAGCHVPFNSLVEWRSGFGRPRG